MDPSEDSTESVTDGMLSKPWTLSSILSTRKHRAKCN